MRSKTLECLAGGKNAPGYRRLGATQRLGCFGVALVFVTRQHSRGALFGRQAIERGLHLPGKLVCGSGFRACRASRRGPSRYSGVVRRTGCCMAGTHFSSALKNTQRRNVAAGNNLAAILSFP
jgi:hypothetical protein